MGKYYHVTFKDIDKVKNYTEKYCVQIVTRPRCTGDYDPFYYDGAAITNVFRRVVTKKIHGIFADKIEKKITFTEALIVCEEKDDYYEDIITGKKFKKANYYNNDNDFISELTVSLSDSLTEQDVVDYLKKFNNQELIRYKDGMEKFIKSFQEGCKQYKNEIEQMKKEKEKTLRYNRQYIEDFKKHNRNK